MKKSELKQIIKEEIHKVLSEIKVEKPTDIKNYILKNFQNYNEEDFTESYNADSGLNDLVSAGSYNEFISFDDDNPNTSEDFYKNLLMMIKASPETKRLNGLDLYEKSWVLDKYPFSDSGKNWTESLKVYIQIPEKEYDVYKVFASNYAQEIEIERSVPFDEEMKEWWEENYS